MRRFDFGLSLTIMRRTAPFLLLRLGVYLGIAAAMVLATGTGAGIGYGVGGFWQDEGRLGGAFWGGAVGFGLTAGVLFFLREYILYMVKAGHIAVMVELLRGRALPDGQGQLAHAQAMVAARFGHANVLFAVDQLVKGVISAVTRLAQGMLSILPIPGLDKIMAIVRAYLRMSVGLLDEVILAHAFDTRAENPYAASRTALVLYAQNARPLMIGAAWITAAVWLLSVVVFVLMLGPAAAIAWFFPGESAAIGILVALILAWAVKAAVLEPFAVACMLQVYFAATDGQAPGPEWEGKLDGVSAKFRSLAERAAGWVGVRPAPGTDPRPEPAA